VKEYVRRTRGQSATGGVPLPSGFSAGVASDLAQGLRGMPSVGQKRPHSSQPPGGDGVGLAPPPPVLQGLAAPQQFGGAADEQAQKRARSDQPLLSQVRWCPAHLA